MWKERYLYPSYRSTQCDYQLYSWIKVGTNTSIEKMGNSRNVTHQSAYGSMLAPALLLDPLTPVYWDSVDDFTTDMKEQYATSS